GLPAQDDAPTNGAAVPVVRCTSLTWVGPKAAAFGSGSGAAAFGSSEPVVAASRLTRIRIWSACTRSRACAWSTTGLKLVNTSTGSVASRRSYWPQRLTRQARYFTGTEPPCSSLAGGGSRLQVTQDRKTSSSPIISSVSFTSTSRTWASRPISAWVGKSRLTTDARIARQLPPPPVGSGTPTPAHA